MKQFKKQVIMLNGKVIEKYVFVPNRVNNLISKYYSFTSECYSFVTNLDNIVRALN